MLVDILASLLLFFHLTNATSPGHLKRTTILNATCKDGYSIETSHLDPEVLICCPKGAGLGGWGTPVIPGLTLIDTKGPICCPNNLTLEQCNAEDNEDRVRPDNVKECWFNYQKVGNTNIQGRFVCAQPRVDILTSNAFDKREAYTINTDDTDSDRFSGGQTMHAACSNDEHGAQAISTVGRETTDALNTICCPQGYPQGGWAETGEPVCCQKLHGHLVDCGGKFGYHVPAKSVVNCRGPGNNMVIYGNTSVCEGPSRQQSRPKVYAMPTPAGPIARPENYTELLKSPGGTKRDAAKVSKSNDAPRLKVGGWYMVGCMILGVAIIDGG